MPLFKQLKSILAIGLFFLISNTTFAQNKIIIGPTGSGQFGRTVTVLPNGNYVVTDPLFDNALTDVGAVYLYNGATHALISTMTGSTANDQIGNGGITVLSNGNYIVLSYSWDNGAIADAGAVTWCNGSTGRVGAVSASNSLVGSSSFDQIGINGITALSNGNYVVGSPNWDNGAIDDAGAVTWCNGTTGRVGALSASNSLVGSSANDNIGSDFIGSARITVLTNGNYVVPSPSWNNGAIANAGAVTWCNGTTGRVGALSASNSLVGSAANDQVGNGGITALTNGNYAVASPAWDNGAIAGAGAATWCDGSTGRVGAISSSNSLVGSSANDAIGDGEITALTNGNYIVRSYNWDNGAIVNAGAVTWCNGSTGRVGAVSASNSLVGSSASDLVGGDGITALSNGNYVVGSQNWNNGAINNAGAVTWCNGTTGRVGAVSASNSLVGSSTNDAIGNGGITALANGNYVVGSLFWDNGAISNAGAVTWGNGTTGIVGAVSASNSLIGTSTSDQIGSDGITSLTNGNYVVGSSVWDNGPIVNAGAATWGNGTTGRVGAVSSSNSLVGASANDAIGIGGITALTNGNYVVTSKNCDNGAIVNAGAVTWGNGTTGIVGAVSSSNSLIGTSASDQIGSDGITSLTNGNYVVRSLNWDNGAFLNAGAITIAPDNAEITGTINSCNSVLGNAASPNPTIFSAFDSTFNYLIVSKPAENKIVIRNFSINTSSFNQTICANQSFLWNGIARNTSGAFKDTFTSFIGCDSIVTLNLTVKPTSSSSINQTICANQSFLWNGIARNTSGAFKDTFTSFSGCDSVVTLNLTVTPLPSKLTNTSGNTITAAQAGATYQWIDCATNAAISGANAQSFTPSSNGNYKVVITLNSCSDTSACVPINPVGLASNISIPKATLSPNPAHDFVHVNLSNAPQHATIHFMTLDGKIIQTNQLNQTDNLIPINTLIPGFYLYEIDVDGNIEKGKLFVE